MKVKAINVPNKTNIRHKIMNVNVAFLQNVSLLLTKGLGSFLSQCEFNRKAFDEDRLTTFSGWNLMCVRGVKTAASSCIACLLRSIIF